MIIEPVRDKDGKVLTNVQLTKICYEQLKNLRDGVGAKNDREREAMEDRYLRICGGSKYAGEIMEFMEQIASEEDEDKAQKLLARGLLPVVDR